jgi:hypothetical protein
VLTCTPIGINIHSSTEQTTKEKIMYLFIYDDGSPQKSDLKTKVYTVHAYKWGDRELHSYSVGVFGSKDAALKEAECHRTYRGGKYECEVIGWDLDDRESREIILSLPF